MLYAIIAAVVILAILAVVLIHNHQSLDAAAAKVDAIAVKVDPVIRAGEADAKSVVDLAKAQTAAAPAQVQPTVAVSVEPASAPAQVQ